MCYTEIKKILLEDFAFAKEKNASFSLINETGWYSFEYESEVF